MGKFVTLENLERFRANMSADVWGSIAAAADGTTIVYDASTKRLSAVGGAGGTAAGLSCGCSLGELEDLTIRTGSFANAGEGWNTFTFPEPFEGEPHVIATAESGYSVEVKAVTATGFLYKVTVGGAVAATTGSYYVFTSKSVSTSYMTQVSLVTGIGGGSETTADAAAIKYTAIEYGGE